MGEALGLRHEDLAIAEKTITVTARDNDNRARAKTGSRTIPASPELMRLYADYLNREYGALDSDYVFVNLWSAPLGRPWSYSAVYDLVKRLRTRTGIDVRTPPFPTHLRHLAAAPWCRHGVGEGTIGARLDRHNDRHLRSPHRRGRENNPGSSGLVHRPGGALVTAPGPRRAPISSGLLEKLIAVVRPEFRVEVYLVDPDDPVLGRRQCAVADCDRPVSENGLCSGHGQRWRDRDRPALAVFLADPGPVLNGRRDLSVCTVIGCRYGSSGVGLCMRHRTAWARAGQPDPGIWSAQAGLLGPPDPTPMWAAVLHRVDRERQDPVLQVSYDPVGPARPPRRRRIPRALPAARHRAHRLPRASSPAKTRIPVRGAEPPRPSHDHRRTADRRLGHPHRHKTPQ